jgi:hypothetical protein
MTIQYRRPSASHVPPTICHAGAAYRLISIRALPLTEIMAGKHPLPVGAISRHHAHRTHPLVREAVYLPL